LDARAWTSVKSRELLLLLLCHPNGCTKEQAALALWPDASASQVRNNFHVTVHRLRRTLGDPEWCVADGDRYKINPAYERQFDATEFEHQAQAGARTRAGEEALPRLAAAIALYRGDFLEHEAIGDWHSERRETLQRLYVDSLAIYATHLAAAGQHAEAAAAYRRLIARDSLAEPAYRGLMTSLVEAGDRAEARRAFDTLVRVLRTELDAGPDPETVALARQLLKPAAT
jgi:DNA-binding SARP family transcriptional activator